MKKIIFKDDEWPIKSAMIISDQIRKVLLVKQKCSVFLTGGRGAERVYAFLSQELKTINGEIYFYLGDERCVSENHPDSNYRMILKTLFPDGIGKSQKLYKMFDESHTPEEAAGIYESVLPASPDLIILGLGDDGHIASLFPGQSWIGENDKMVICSVSPVNGLQRVTITKKVIERAVKIIILASGKMKSRILHELGGNTNISEIPARIVITGFWLLDENASGFNLH
jgi:6-phosphogluconolactonase